MDRTVGTPFEGLSLVKDVDPGLFFSAEGEFT